LRVWANITLIDVAGCAPGIGGENLREINTDEIRDCKHSALLPLVLDAILEVAPVQAVYVGWSLGGQLVNALADRNPQRVIASISLCSNPRFVATNSWPGMSPHLLQAFRDEANLDPSKALRRFVSLEVEGAKRARAAQRTLRVGAREAANTLLLAGLEWLESLDQREQLGQLQQPQLHILGGQDALVPAALEASLQRLFSSLDSAEVVLLDEASHIAPLENADEIATVIEGFLRRFDLLGPSTITPLSIDKLAVAASFSGAAQQYDSVAGLQRDVGEHLLTRLSQVGESPLRILDLGCGTGFFREKLQAMGPDAQYLGIDIAQGMVSFSRHAAGANCEWLVGDAEALPLASSSIDWVFSSLAIQWCQRLDHVFAELARVLRPGGRCVFTSLGPSTLCELRAAWAEVDDHQHVNEFTPLKELQAQAAKVPGLSMEVEVRTFTMRYARVGQLMSELKTLGAHNMNQKRSAGLTSRGALQGMIEAYEAFRVDEFLPATYEVYIGSLEVA